MVCNGIFGAKAGELRDKAAAGKEKRQARREKMKKTRELANSKVKSGVKKAAVAVAGKVKKTVKDAKKSLIEGLILNIRKLDLRIIISYIFNRFNSIIFR